MKRIGKKNESRIASLVFGLIITLVVIIGVGLYLSSRYIKKQLLLANQNDAVDVATIINNNFPITDDEVTYLKTLSFNEMEQDPLNLRLVNTVNGLSLNQKVSNIYILIPLADEEIKYTTDEKTSEFFGYKVGTKLNGMWLLNGKFDSDGKFVPAVRDDVYRYLELCSSDLKVFQSRKSFGHVTEDAWGKFITGYTPFYSAEGTFVGILGIDMDINLYNANAFRMTSTVIGVFVAIIAGLMILFLMFFIKYMKAKESVLYYDFYSRLSHDMRTPMNGILGIAALSEGERNPDILQDNIRKMETSGKYLLALVNDTLDFQKMQSGKLELHPDIVDTRELVIDIKNMVAETAREKNIQFVTRVISTSSDDYIYADGMRLKQIFVNLLSNAVKFTAEGGMVEWLIAVPSRDGMVSHNVITVRDTGIGMSESFVKHKLFQPFAQEYHSFTAKYAGTGLGLSIVKNLIGQMGGRIEVESEQGEGTTFTVYLDFEKVDNEKAEQKLQRSSVQMLSTSDALKDKKILVAEDHALNAEIARRLLERAGCLVDLAENGEQAVSVFEQSPEGEYDAILMDIRMPVMDGLEAARHIRALKRDDARSVPIIAMTANAYDEDIKKSHDAGMNAHLAKPIDLKALYETLEQFVGQAAEQAEKQDKDGG